MNTILVIFGAVYSVWSTINVIGSVFIFGGLGLIFLYKKMFPSTHTSSVPPEL